MELADIDIRKVHQAFSPAMEITDPQLFVGRREEIKNAINALLNPGSFLAIFGLRGVGKTSLAHQIKLIAQGNTLLPHALGLERLLPRKNFDFIVHYYRSDKFVKNTSDLIKRILFGDDDNPSLFSLTKTGDKKLAEFKRIVGADANIGFFGARAGARGQEETTYTPYISDDLVQQFRSLLGALRKENKCRDGILILVDEFDTIADKTGFASIVKACSSEFVKFGVVGIGSTVTDLVKDHSSIRRQIDFINVPLMLEVEMHQVLNRAEYRVEEAITFSAAARTDICRRAEGFPYFVHLLGKEAMLLAYERNSKKVTDSDIDALSHYVAEGRLTNVFESYYHEVVKNSPQREMLLKLFAEEEDHEITIDNVYGLAKDMGVNNPSQQMKVLTSSHNTMSTPVLIKSRDKHYRFTDPVFKVYAKIRNWKHSFA